MLSFNKRQTKHMQTTQHRTWCDEDEHFLYENFVDFNDWLEDEENEETRKGLGISDLTQPSKALFASDREAYDQAFKEFRNARRHEALNEDYFIEQFGDNHWFQRSFDHFLQLVDRIQTGDVVPFIGAGISVAGGFPTWEDHLHEQGRTANLSREHIQAMLDNGEYEAVLEEIESKRSRDVFTQEMKDVFSRTGSIPEAIWRVSELFPDTLITTNYDHLLEQAFDTGQSSVQVLNGKEALKPDANSTTIIMLHGDIRKPQECILSKQQYDQAYGEQLNQSLVLPKLLSYYYQNSSLLFLGCSLNTDRTVEVFKSVRESLGEEQVFPPHFSIEQAPEDAEELAARNAYLASLGITPIWFQKNGYEYVENILRLAKSEVNYRRDVSTNNSSDPLREARYSAIELEPFLRDFVDVMPLLHWIQRSIPQEATQQYLSAMQRVFIGQSILTDSLNEDLVCGLDNLLRALSSKASFDGYTHGKLSVAFSSFQKYLKGRGLDNYADSEYKWDYHEMLSIPQTQFDGLANSENRSIDDCAVRLIIMLLRHGKKQQESHKLFCQLPEAINHEFTDYLSEALDTRLGIIIPDRLDEDSNEGIRHLCKMTWDNFDKPVKPGFVELVRLAFPSLSLR